jgi:hypothetical protein
LDPVAVSAYLTAHSIIYLAVLNTCRCAVRCVAGSYAKTLGRFLVCLYFINIVYEDFETYRFMSTPEMMARVRRFPERYPAPSFPYIEVMFLLPCAVLAIFGWRVPVTGSILVLDMLKDSGTLIWNQTCAAPQHNPLPPHRPSNGHFFPQACASSILGCAQ